MTNLLLNFGGFYCSNHQQNIDYAVELCFNVDEGGTIPDNIKYKPIFEAYAKEWLDKFEEYLSDETNKDIVLSYNKLVSPKYYNYSTDKIDLNVSNSSKGKILEYAFSLDFDKYLKEKTKSYDGYMSYYTYEEALNDKDNILVSFALDYLAGLFNEDYNSMYEINTFELVCELV